jgi:hypothetical protein
MGMDVMIDAHNKTIKLGIRDVVARLNSHLGATAVAALSDVRDSKLPYRWVNTDGPEPSAKSIERLQLAHRLWMVLADAEGDHVARSWFLGSNPMLGETSPVLALRAGNFEEVRTAAGAFVDGTWQG